MKVLRLSYEPEDDVSGELYVSAAVPGFSAESSAWFDREAIEAFAAALEKSLLPSEPPTGLFGGVWGEDQSMPEHIEVGISIVPGGADGDLLVRVELSSSDEDSTQEAVLSFAVDYESVDRFRAALVRMLDDSDAEAVLAG
jgi:hypothetical protein